MTTPTRTQRRWTLFRKARELPEAQREAFLRQACGDDRELFDELIRLVQSAAPEDFLASAALGPGLDAPHDPGDDPLLGARLDDFTLEAVLGRGGMGTVYRALESGALERVVAIKVVRRGVDTDQVLQRFRAEQATLARLTHPALATVHRAGSTPDGRPWFAMEFVDGRPLTEFCQAQDTPLERRMALFIELCGVVQYIHQKGFIHRDLKPSNILVRDEDGAIKLIDFGIVRALDATPEARLTQHVPSPGTPAYMSPEQLDDCDDPDTRSDIYALGVVLYELLTGELPFGSLQGRALTDAIRTREPQTPSRRLAEPDNPVATRHPGWRTRLQGDFDWIVMQALARERERRYPSAAALAEDLQRALEHRPVTARPPSRGYLIGRFVRRHWHWLSATAFGVAGLIALVVLLTLSNQRVDRALATSNRNLAQAGSTVDFLTRLFELSDRTRQGGAVPDALDILRRGRNALEHEAGLQAELRLPLLLTLARIHANLGENSEALALVRQAHELIAEVPDRKVDVWLETGRIQFQAGDLEASRSSLKRALEALTQLGAPDRDELQARVRLALGTTEQHLGQLEEAGRQFRASALLVEGTQNEDQERSFGDARASPDLRAEILLRLGSWEWSNGNLEAAGVQYQRAIEALQALGERYLPERARAIDAHAAALYALGRYDVAAAQYRDAVTLRRRVLGDRHQHTADSLSNLGAVYYELGQDGQAEPPLREARAIYAALGDGDHQALGKILNNLGLVRLRIGDLVEAESLFSEALGLHRQALGENHSKVAGNLNNLGLVAERRGDLARAEALYEQARDILLMQFSPSHPALGFSAINWARIALLQGRYTTADEGFQRGLELRRSGLGENHPATASSHFWIGISHCVQGRHQPAIEPLEVSLMIRRERLGASHPDTLSAAAALARCSELAGVTDRPEVAGLGSWKELRPRLAPSDPAMPLLDSLPDSR